MTPSYTGKTILITGGTGSFGSTVVHGLLGRDHKEIRVLSRDEAKQDAMRTSLPPGHRVRFYIGDVRDARSVAAAMRGVDLVFHAAALKQVPSCEFFPLEAVATNVAGSANVVRAADEASVESVVLLSTDKAVYPINAMGMSKALMEKVGQAAARELAGSGTTVSTVRYGNVMYSRGSVIPLFVQQIRAGQPLTITVPGMTRFLMPLAHAVDLVEFALLHAEPGDVFIRKAPAATIADVATAVQNVFGASVGTKQIGIRHGEKLYETLATAHELRRGEDYGDYLRVPLDDRNLDYAKYFSEGDQDEDPLDDFHSHNTRRLSVPEVEKLLRSLPEIEAELAAWDGPA
ncbi:MAG TPA: polysaccharide biosynthesis protein [Acidimicrobiales bacterium]|jgi:UDP-glucose 4-epimerase|nr:polysaccharide biosynthesis protein [Acidimicrobiales bacterium]